MKQILYLLSAFLLLIACNERGEKVVHIHQYNDNYFEQQLAYLDELIDDDDENAHAYFLKAKLYIDNKEYSKALIEVEKAIKLEPNFPNYYFLQGQIFYKQQAWKKALDVISKAEKLGMKQIELYELLAKIHTELQHTTDAEQYINRISQLDPDNYNLNFLRAINSYYVSDTLYAVRRFELAIKDSLNIEECLHYLAKIHIARKQYDQAIIKIDKVINRLDNPIDFFLLKAEMIEQQGFVDSAFVLYKESWKLDTLHQGINQHLAKLVYQRKDYDSTLYYLVKLKNDSSFDNHLLRADAYFGLRDYPNSIEYYQKALLYERETEYISRQLSRIEWRINYRKKQEFAKDSIQKSIDNKLKIKKDSL